MQPDGSGTWAAVEAEGKRALACVANVILDVSDIKDAGLGRAVFELQQDGAGGRRVLDLLPADLQGAFGLNDFFFRNRRFLFFLGFLRRFIRRWLGLLLGEASIHPKKKKRNGPQVTN